MSVGWALAVSVLLPGAEPARPPSVWFVDLRGVLLASPDGKRVRQEIDRKRAAVDADVRAREDALFELRKRLEKTGDPALRVEYDRRAGEHEAYIREQVLALEAAGDAGFQPAVDKLVALLDIASADERGVLVLDREDHPPLAPISAEAGDYCDATSWLARANAGEKVALPGAEARCRPHGVAYVDLKKVIASVDEAKAASAKLAALQNERQAELDRGARAVREANGPEAERMRLDLADRYASWQRDLAAREERESARIESLVLERLAKTRALFPKALFLRKVEGVDALPGSCDATPVFIESKGEPPKASVLEARCPGLKG